MDWIWNNYTLCSGKPVNFGSTNDLFYEVGYRCVNKT